SVFSSFPYSTLFRSVVLNLRKPIAAVVRQRQFVPVAIRDQDQPSRRREIPAFPVGPEQGVCPISILHQLRSRKPRRRRVPVGPKSEEHTSELQSRFD